MFARLGKKIVAGLKSGTRMGGKALGTANRIGQKISSVGNAVVGAVEASPFGARLAKPIAVAKTGLGLIHKASEWAGKGEKALQEVDKVVRAGESALESKKPSGAGAGNKVAHDLGAGLQQQKVSQRDISLGSDVPKTAGGRAPKSNGGSRRGGGGGRG
jgi:hypothetical protein